MVVKQESGYRSKKEGHKFEGIVAKVLTERFNKEFITEGDSKTKIDVRDINSKIRLSVKNPINNHTQIGLYSQKSFIESMNITDNDIIDFIGKFFGGNDYTSYSRHRMTKSDIDTALNQKFTDFLNNNTTDILKLLLTHGTINQVGNVNYLVWASKKNDPNNLLLIDLDKFKQDITNGKWIQNETTFHFIVNGKKLFHLQMKGSGKKYSSGYHSLMFHIFQNFEGRYIKDLGELEKLL